MEAPVVRPVATPLVGVGSHRRTGEHGEKALMTLWRNLVVALVAAFALAACSSSNDPEPTAMPEPPPTAEPEPEPTPAENQMTQIDSAREGLTTALTALDADSPTSAQIAAVSAAIALLDAALTGAVDLSPNQTAAARDHLATARTTLSTAQTTYAEAQGLEQRRTAQMGAIGSEETALANAISALMADDAASIAAVNAAITALQGAVEAAADLTDAEKMGAMSALMDAEVSAATAELDMYKAAATVAGATDAALLAAYEGKLKSATRLVAALAANNGSAADIAEANKVIGSATTMIASLKVKIETAKAAVENAKRLASNAVSTQVGKAVKAHKLAGETRAGTALPHAFKDHTDPTGVVAVVGTNDTRWQITRFSGNAKIRLNQAEDVAADDKYASAPVASASSWYAGWGYSRDSMSGRRPVEEMAAVFTDIEEADDEAWEDYFGDDAADATGLVTLSGRDGAGDEPPIIAERVSSGVLPRAPEGADSSELREIATAAKTTATTIRGTFYGVSGVYTCPATTLCTVARDRDGVLTFVGLTFTPTVSATDTLTGDDATVKAKYADPDGNYTHFGYWMRSTTLRDGTKTHMIETFHGGGNATPLALGDGTTTTVQGTATYYGAAAGVYVKNDGAGDSLVVTDGTFTADAMLIAKFRGDRIATADHNTVTGTISDFMDGSTDLGFADLILEKASISNLGAIGGERTTGTPATAIAGETNGGGTSGNWTGQFYGNLGADNDAAGGNLPNGLPVASDNFPADVAGEFNGHFENGHVAGAFGANYDE